MRRTTPVAAATVFVLSTTGCGLLGLGSQGGAEPSPSPTPVSAAPLFEEALAALEESPAIQLQGQFSDPQDTSNVVNTSLTVTDAGAALGTFQVGTGGEASYFEADGKLFVKADSDYWLTHDVFNPDSDAYPDNWVRITHEQFGLDPGGVLTPAGLAESLRTKAPGADAEAVEEKLDGVLVYRVELSGGTAWITSEAPHTLVRMQIEELAPAEGEGVASRIDASFAEVDTAAVEQLYDDLAKYAGEELESARDARLEVAWAEELGGDCQTGGACTMVGKVEETSGATEGSILVRMDSRFNNDELGEKTCTKTAELKAGGTVELSCSIDYALAPSANPVTYTIDFEALLSTRALSKDAREQLVATINEQREATLSGGDTAEEGGEEAESS
ncbi:LolA-like protein [Thermobifida cellulosilytica]|uniref:hypothetical protein n=1 Tax=Thermobifida cellulosilytica TaxID=144786 RepID=UPI001E4233CF|nr:hypothetical protein [Thermobifida cellulosilytica]